MHSRLNSISKPFFNLEAGSPFNPASPRSVSPNLAGNDPFHRRFLSKFLEDIDPSSVDLISIYMCFLTGLTASPSFAACFVWCGFQTGNAAQLGLAIAKIFTSDEHKTIGFQKLDQQALTSLLTFLMGAVVGQLGNRVGGRKRIWLIGATLGQMLLMMAAALAAHFCGESGLSDSRGDPSWITPIGMAALGFLSAAMGLQGAVGTACQKLGTPLGTTVPLTSTWIDLFNDPFLFSIKHIHTRDVRALGCFALVLGAVISRAILGAIGQASTIAVVIGFRAILAAWWFWLPNAPLSEEVLHEVGKA
ncbi:hypothetical protein I305_02901 [Cryptococcus gattii E566]|uniref:Uncharacterized protein n=2 Tax=Cryptococcus gattii TaxID=37769 RepID=E6R6W2_CRYGW|nr:uncharacterized protein CGB_E2640C [Cryptococcus gattii WM276]ADV22442.1 hypothetical protein CNBE2070 [Cryptococcus gattii WM276]KIR78529.1 hypothetical protein I306_04457 [Cryptococcus gattii EJB2]KIY34709.1 hypothetical protein I305_02901 [Cryptococcus gattii E566]KJE00560.1 hypothetical protein I311_05827 [Cryptococcus gattii NT-10]